MARERGSVQISIRFPSGVLDRIDYDIDTYREHVTRTEFIIDAVKNYLDYRIKMKVQEKELMESDLPASTKSGSGRA